MLMNLEQLQSTVGYRFSSVELLSEALTHRSFGTPHNERLEFLGDSILNCVVSIELFSRYTQLNEGELSRLRAHHVRQESLFAAAKSIELGRYLRLGEGELKSGGFTRPSILADAFEALIGAVYLDGGFVAVHSTVSTLLEEALRESSPGSFGKDPKTLLQEYLQGRRLALPRYSVVATAGAAHSQSFEVECVIEGLSLRTVGIGASRRTAEQMAAQTAYERVVNDR